MLKFVQLVLASSHVGQDDLVASFEGGMASPVVTEPPSKQRRQHDAMTKLDPVQVALATMVAQLVKKDLGDMIE